MLLYLVCDRVQVFIQGRIINSNYFLITKAIIVGWKYNLAALIAPLWRPNDIVVV